MKRVCVFCGSRRGRRPEFARAAELLAESLVQRDLGLVFGGSKLGLMGILADAVLARGGAAVGVIPELLMKQEVVHDGLTELRVVASMHERKATMAELSDGFISLPGGLGTWEETFEILTWRTLGIHDKPCGLLNVEDYFAPMLGLFEHGLAEGFLRPEQGDSVFVDSSPEALLAQMQAYVAKPQERFLSLKES